ncbi:MAG: hypothetical protein P4L41_02210 [Flavipsychrobacter sp.]|nr:hypothetical protein [Flavipsychrobacter sp.]
MIKIILGALAYIIPSMPWGYFWHLKVFKKKYDKWEFFGPAPSVPLAFLAMFIQGTILSLTYAFLPIEHTSAANVFAFASIMGIFFWSRVVVPTMASHVTTRTPGFFLLETAYLIGQYALFGAALYAVYSFV